LFLNAPGAAAHAEDLLLACLGGALATGEPRDRSSDPGYVRCAERYLIEHLSDDVSVSDVARAADVPERTLFDGFKRANGVGPLAWLRAERLERARAELVSARRGEVRITDVAMRWGFQHLGRFCVAYQARFGETPTATLRGDR
jgi:AraC-like DNA-binding protein